MDESTIHTLKTMGVAVSFLYIGNMIIELATYFNLSHRADAVHSESAVVLQDYAKFNRLYQLFAPVDSSSPAAIAIREEMKKSKSKADSLDALAKSLNDRALVSRTRASWPLYNR